MMQKNRRRRRIVSGFIAFLNCLPYVAAGLLSLKIDDQGTIDSGSVYVLIIGSIFTFIVFLLASWQADRSPANKVTEIVKDLIKENITNSALKTIIQDFIEEVKFASFDPQAVRIRVFIVDINNKDKISQLVSFPATLELDYNIHENIPGRVLATKNRFVYCPKLDKQLTTTSAQKNIMNGYHIFAGYPLSLPGTGELGGVLVVDVAAPNASDDQLKTIKRKLEVRDNVPIESLSGRIKPYFNSFG